MAGLRGNEAWLAFGKQSGKGSPAATATFKNPFSGGNIAPVRETDQLAETDSSRDRGQTYVTTSGAEGDPEVYVRDDSVGALLFAVLGADAVTGVGPNYTHSITPANVQPYYTFWRGISSTLFERFDDCKVGSLTISADAGQPLTASLGVTGRDAERLVADPSGAWTGVDLADGAVYNYNEASVTLGGGATALVGSFELSIENNVSPQQTDDVVPYDVVEGTREVSLGFDLIFETLAEYNKFHYGGAAGTEISKDVFTTSASFTFTKGTNNEVAFTLPSIAYEEFDVAPDPGGDPIVVAVRAAAQRNTPIITATIKNQVATY